MKRKSIRKSQLERELNEMIRTISAAHPDIPLSGRLFEMGARWVLDKNVRITQDEDKVESISTPNRSFTERMSVEYGMSRSRVYVILHGTLPAEAEKRAIANEIRGRAVWESENHTLSKRKTDRL
ncbi:MAG: hypothetical protein IKM71_07500 [Bacteroidaceae bacterium]|nr:hypothetical protein [Bacteroidaceae bacterium]